MSLEKLISDLFQIEKVVVSDHSSSLTGVELASNIYQTVEELKLNGFGDGKIVIYRMTNSIDCIITFFALVLSKSAIFISNPHDPISRFYDNIDRFRPYALLANSPSILAIAKRNNHNNVFQYNFKRVSLSANIFTENKASLASYHPAMKNADIAIFSSGSTGNPKAILHSIENLLENARLHVDAVGLKQSDVMGVTLPLYYSYGLVANLLGSFVAKARISLHRQTGVVDCDWIVREKITFIGLTPYFASMLKQPLPSLRVVTLGGDILYKERALHLMQDFPNCQFYSTYGLTEAGPRVATWKFDQKTLESGESKCTEIVPLGKPLDGVSLFLKDEHGNDSISGELVLKTPTRMLGYYHGVVDGYDMPEKITGEVHTDDLFETHKGNMYFVGRKKQIIVQGGEKLFPIALESVIRKIEGVIDAKVGSIPDDEKGQVAKAYIVAENTVSIALVHKVLLGHFTRSLIPAKLEFVDSITRTLTGKVA